MSLCRCGCGQLAPIAKRTNTRSGHRKGEPMRYVANHHPRLGRNPQTPLEAITRNVVPGAPDDCWPWRGLLSSKGYGVVGLAGEQKRAHRVAYEVAKGPIPSGLLVRHTCDNPPCCNPAHLLVGTQQDNTDDKVSRQRHVSGERCGQARLTERAVITARARYAAGASIVEMAREYGVAEATLRQAVNGHSWKHVGAVA